MRKKVALYLLFCAAWSITAIAQNNIDSIRQKYKEVHDMIADMMPDENNTIKLSPEYYEINVTQNLPGTGPHDEVIRMFYGELESEEEGNPYPPHFLLFVTAKYNFAAREFYEEYLYDKDGNVMFIFAITPDVDDYTIPYELRMWFDGKRLLKFTAKEADKSAKYDSLKDITFNEVYSGKTIPEKYLLETERCQQQARRLLKMFKGIDDNKYQ